MAATEHKVNFAHSEFHGRCWADVGSGSCSQWAATSVGLCAEHFERLRSSS